MYYIIGNLTYSNQSNRNTAQTNVNNVLAGFPEVTGVATASLPAGVTTSGTTVLRLSLQCPDEMVEQVRMALLTAWSSAARSTYFISAVKAY